MMKKKKRGMDSSRSHLGAGLWSGCVFIIRNERGNGNAFGFTWVLWCGCVCVFTTSHAHHQPPTSLQTHTQPS